MGLRFISNHPQDWDQELWEISCVEVEFIETLTQGPVTFRKPITLNSDLSFLACNSRITWTPASDGIATRV